MRATHINITIPEGLKSRVDAESEKEGIGRSTLIQKALRLYLTLVNKKKIKALLCEGYKEMAHESVELIKEFEGLDEESLKYVD